MVDYVGWKPALTAALGKVGETLAVEQVTLNANLDYTLPTGTPAGVVHRVVFTQTTGGHPVTYDGAPVTVDLAAGASTTVELHPVGAGHAISYPVTNLDAQVSALAEDGGSALGASLSSTFETLTQGPTSRPERPRPTWVTTFQSGHGWTALTGSIADDTSTYAYGTQSLHVLGIASKTQSLDLTGKALAILLRINTLASTAQIKVQTANSAVFSAYKSWNVQAGNVPSPHLPVGTGEWVLVTLPWESAQETTGTPTRGSVGSIRIRTAGTGDCDFHVQAIGTVPVSTGASNARITFTFDDSWASDVTAARILSARGIAATTYVIPDKIGLTGRCTVADLQTLRRLHRWDIQAHSDAANYTLMTEAELRAEWVATKKFFAANGLGRAEHLAYPGGYSNTTVVNAARDYFSTARTTYSSDGINATWQLGTYPPAEPMRLRARSSISSHSGGASVASVQTHIDYAVTGGLWLILVFHSIVPTTTSSTSDCREADLATIADYAVASGAQIGTIADFVGGGS